MAIEAKGDGWSFRTLVVEALCVCRGPIQKDLRHRSIHIDVYLKVV